jgi:dephospho-CoA kinase
MIPPMGRVFPIGLTGGIGAGKSTIAGMFQTLGVPFFDADLLGRVLIAEGTAGARAIRSRFPSCATAGEGVDRARLSELVFADPAARQWLEALLHPAIRDEFLARASALPRRFPFCLLEGAVLLESQCEFGLAGLIVVFAPLRSRRLRVALRGGLPLEQIEARLGSQWPQHLKMLRAHHLIDNGGDLDHARAQVQSTFGALCREFGV